MNLQLMYEHEEIDFECEINESSGKQKYFIKGVFSSPGRANKNGRIYPMKLWETEVNKYQEVISKGLPNSLMELEHPARTNVEMMEAVAKIEKLYIENGLVMGEAVLLNNPKANQLKTLIDSGIKLSVSSRGLGSVKNGLVESYKLITFDIISNLGASDFGAEMYGVVEGVLQGKEFALNENGSVSEVTSLSSIFKKEHVEQAIKERFVSVLSEIVK